MIANIRMAKKSRRPICRRGTMAFMMDFNTICRPGRKERE
jgi:tartrate dehydratase alpha subunit/fumarate hydratase class I-like protein